MDQAVYRIFCCNNYCKSVSRLYSISCRIEIYSIIMIFTFFKLDAVLCRFRCVTCFRITQICKCTCDHTVFFMYSIEFCLIKCRKISAIHDSAFFYCRDRNNISFRIYSLDTVEFFVTYITEKHCNLYIIHFAGYFGITKLHGQCIHIVSVFRIEICFDISVF